MVRAVIQYEREPEPERYARHLEEFTAKVECQAFRHGRVFGSPFGEPPFAYYAEFEWTTSTRSRARQVEEFAASGKDAWIWGSRSVAFAEFAE